MVPLDSSSHCGRRKSMLAGRRALLPRGPPCSSCSLVSDLHFSPHHTALQAGLLPLCLLPAAGCAQRPQQEEQGKAPQDPEGRRGCGHLWPHPVKLRTGLLWPPPGV